MGSPLFLAGEYPASATIDTDGTATGFDQDNMLTMEEGLRWKPNFNTQSLELRLFDVDTLSPNAIGFLANEVLDGVQCSVSTASGAFPTASTDDMATRFTNLLNATMTTLTNGVRAWDGISIPWEINKNGTTATSYVSEFTSVAVDTNQHAFYAYVKKGTSDISRVFVSSTGGNSQYLYLEIDWTQPKQSQVTESASLGNTSWSASDIPGDWIFLELYITNNNENTGYTFAIEPNYDGASTTGSVYAFGCGHEASTAVTGALAMEGRLSLNNNAAILTGGVNGNSYTTITLDAGLEFGKLLGNLEIANVALFEALPLPSLMTWDAHNSKVTGSSQVSSAGYYNGSVLRKVMKNIPLKWPPMSASSSDFAEIIAFKEAVLDTMRPFYFVPDEDETDVDFCWFEDNPSFSAPISNKTADHVTVAQINAVARRA